MYTREEQIRGLRELKAKQVQIQTLNEKIAQTKAKINKLRKQRKSTAKLDLLPTDTAKTLENKFLWKNSRGKQLRRILLKGGILVLLLGMIAAVAFLLYSNRELILQNQPDIQEYFSAFKAKHWPLMTIVFSVGMLLFTFIPWVALLGGLIFSIIGALVVGAAILWCFLALRPISTVYAIIPLLSVVFCVLYQVLDWRTYPAPLSDRQMQQIQDAQERDEQNHQKNQKDRMAYSENLEKEQRAQILEMNDQINEYEDQIEDLEDQLAENDLLVGDQLEQLDAVLQKLESGKAQSIREALFSDVADAYVFDQAESDRLDREARASASFYTMQMQKQQEASLAAEAQALADEHNRKIRGIHKQQDEAWKKIDEIRKEQEETYGIPEDVQEVWDRIDHLRKERDERNRV